MFKTREDIDRVVKAGKAQAVVDLFIKSYLEGVYLTPIFEAEREYLVLQAQEDVPDIEPEYWLDLETSLPTTEVRVSGSSPNQLRDDRIAELETLFPHVVQPADDSTLSQRRPVPSTDVAGYVTENLVDDLRRAAYPPIGDQLDAIWKQMSADAKSGKALEPDAVLIIGEVEGVKTRIPKVAAENELTAMLPTAPGAA